MNTKRRSAGGFRRGRLRMLLGAALVAVAGFSSTAAAQQLTTLYSFTGSGAGDGANPEAGLIADPAGNLYGTTRFGGVITTESCRPLGCGTVFQLTPSGTLNVLYSFSGSDGAQPFAGLIADTAGNLYGTTWGGGAPCIVTIGCGTVFQLDPSGSLTVLHSFTNGSDGGHPVAGLIADAAGNLYGTTQNGGDGGYGTVFRLDPSGTLIVLHSFTGGSDGGTPVAGLIADEAGNLYGTTSAGGDRTNCAAQFIDGCGTVFQLDPSGTLNVLYNFTGGSDGGNPDAALIADAAGNLYGTTQNGGAPESCNRPAGCGTVFQLTPSRTLNGLHIFTGSDGAYPPAGLLADAAGNLYGTTYGGGTGTGCIGGGACGTVFELTVSASFIGGRARRNMNTKRLGQAVPRMGHP